ncbi:MAG: ATP synthase F1 subunit epsilon [Pseudomonadota bacterium]
MAMTIHVDIVSADKPIFSSGQATFVVAPTTMGELGITPRHTQLLATLKPGEVRVTDDQGNTSHYFVSGGVIEVQPLRITILADSALREEDARAVELAAEEARLSALESKGAIAEGAEVDYFRLQSELIEGAERLRWIREMRGTRTNISQ